MPPAKLIGALDGAPQDVHKGAGGVELSEGPSLQCSPGVRIWTFTLRHDILVTGEKSREGLCQCNAHVAGRIGRPVALLPG